MGNSGELFTGTWRELARPDARRAQLWVTGGDTTYWAVCGLDWDAVAITPMGSGLDVLDSMRLGQCAGYPVLGDLLTDTLYVLVPPAAGSAAAGYPGVRVLSRGSQLIMPRTGHGTAAAHWISAPRAAGPRRLVPVHRLLAHLAGPAGAASREAS